MKFEEKMAAIEKIVAELEKDDINGIYIRIVTSQTRLL